MWPLGLGLLSAADKRPGAKARFLPWPLFRSLKATAPSVSLMLKHQGTRFALCSTGHYGSPNKLKTVGTDIKCRRSY
ncbi:hypothetical protein HDF15_002397 [Granulicella mallensis]|uniref:Uncharacterized protein n=1 Tax=Granulicella mallensis TaxID=940614 RepID=A0A7W7ZQR1_9BACT|nr:hypothetical protein [Granulicella mallensis]